MTAKSSNNTKNIVLIGAGNLATHLGIHLQKKGYKIEQVYSRSFASTLKLTIKLKSIAVKESECLKTDADFYIICVKDDAIKSVSDKLKKVKGIVLHTSGSISLNVLKKHEKAGVLYPLQTFSKEKKQISFSKIPLFIESNSPEVLKALKTIAEDLSGIVKEVDTKQRQILHLAAVFSSNFSNYLFRIADDILKKHQLDFSLLFPLIEETVKKIKTVSPSEAQTGPAIRGDKKTIEQHLKLLKNETDYLKVYQLLNDLIAK